MHTHEHFGAMDTGLDLIVVPEGFPAAAILSVRLLFEQQEAMFSRFRPSVDSRSKRRRPWVPASMESRPAGARTRCPA